MNENSNNSKSAFPGAGLFAFTKNAGRILEWTGIFTVTGIFSLAATVSSLSDKSNVVNVVIWDTVFLGLMVLSWILALGRLRTEKKNICCWIRENRLFLVFLGIAAGLRLLQLNTLPRWDSETYFVSLTEGCSAFAFTLKSYIKAFRLAGHTSLGFALIWAVGAYLTPQSVIGVQLINLLVTVFVMTRLYMLLRRVLAKQSAGLAALGVLLISMEPMFLGTFCGISLDFALTAGTLLLLCFHFAQEKILFIFCAALIAQTKEVGLIYLAGYGCGYGLKCLISGCGSVRRRILNCFRDIWLDGLLLTALLMLAYYAAVISADSLRIWGGGIRGEDASLFVNYFSADVSYIILKLKTVFLLNFSWLFSGMLLAGLFIKRHAGRRLQAGQEDASPAWNECLWGYLGGLAALFIFNAFYITYNNPRYILPLAMGIAFLAVVAVLRVSRRTGRAVVLLTAFTFLCAAQAYTTVDPVTLLSFTRVNSGSPQGMVHTGWEKTDSLIADIAVYNYQTAFLDKAYDRMLREEGWDENSTIIIGGDWHRTRAAFPGGMKTKLYWDEASGRRTMAGPADACPIRALFADRLGESDPSDLPEMALLLWTPMFGSSESEVLEQISGYYKVTQKHEVSIPWQGNIYYYLIQQEGG